MPKIFMTKKHINIPNSLYISCIHFGIMLSRAYIIITIHIVRVTHYNFILIILCNIFLLKLPLCHFFIY